MPQVTITEVRNAQSLNAENTAFDVEINHPEFGWIPYSLQPDDIDNTCLLYTSPSPRDRQKSRMPSSA